jgi:hypothetical protein
MTNVRLMTIDDLPKIVALKDLKVGESHLSSLHFTTPNIAVGCFDGDTLKSFVLASNPDPTYWVLDYMCGNMTNGLECIDFCLKYFEGNAINTFYYVCSLAYWNKFKATEPMQALLINYQREELTNLRAMAKPEAWISKNILHGFLPRQDLVLRKRTKIA